MFSKLMVRRFSTSLLRQRGLVVGAYESGEGADCLELSPVAQKLDEGLEGKLREALNGMPTGVGKLGKATTLTNLSGEFPQIAVAGLGAKDADFNQIEYLDEGRESVRIATGVGARALQAMGVHDIAVEGFNKPETAAEGSTLGVWYFTDKDVETKVALHEGGGDPEDWERGVTKADAQNLVRCLCETPPNYMTPRVLAMRARDLLCPYGVQVYARDSRWMKIHHFDSLLSLAASSTEPPMLLDLNYCADPVASTRPYMFIGQGTMFNSGGLCLRECQQMMRADFASAAVIMGVVKAVSAMRLPINLRAFIPLYEDRLAGASMKPGDALRVRDTVLATEQTQNFPQVVTAEAIAYATKRFPPELLFAIGTHSPNVQSMIGATSAVWARNDYVWDHVNYAGAVTGDRMWRLPLFHDYHERITGSTHSRWTLLFIEPVEVLNEATRVRPSFPGCTSSTMAAIHFNGGRLSSFTKTSWPFLRASRCGRLQPWNRTQRRAQFDRRLFELLRRSRVRFHVHRRDGGERRGQRIRALPDSERVHGRAHARHHTAALPPQLLQGTGASGGQERSQIGRGELSA